MAKGYPEVKAPPPEVPELLPKGVCLICKRRPAVEGQKECAICAEALRPD